MNNQKCNTVYQNGREKIVIVGFGWVGQANALSLVHLGYDVYFYDVAKPTLHYSEHYQSLYDKLKRAQSLAEVDSLNTYYIVCVGDKVAQNGDQDISLIKNVLSSLKDFKGCVILRSTILPYHLASLSFDFYVPEFLHEKKAIEESINPHYYVLGIRNKEANLPNFLKVWGSRASKSFVGTPEEASYIKYLSNSWNALRIAFVNEFGNIIANPSNPQKVADIEKVIDFLFERKAYMKYGRSFGGHCLPKDTRAFFNWNKKQGKNMSLMEGMYISNEIHQKLEAENPHLPEWFSEWVRPQMSGRAALSALWFSIDKKMKRIIDKVILTK